LSPTRLVGAEQTIEEDRRALEGGGGGLCRLQPPSDGGGTATARAEGRRSTAERQRWRRGDDTGEGVAALEMGARTTVRNVCTLLV
jgi:hypothetical protein